MLGGKHEVINMTNVLIIGATGTLGSAARQTLLKETDAQLTLLARHANRLQATPGRERVVAGSVTDSATLDDAIAGQDFVFAARSGDLPTYVQAIVDAMKRQGVKRLAFISSMGIYGELPARLGGDGTVAPVLRPYRQAADIVEESGLDYTVIRPGWFTGGPVNYELTVKGEPFGGHDASVASIADLVKRLVVEPGFGVKESLGINTPGS